MLFALQFAPPFVAKHWHCPVPAHGPFTVPEHTAIGAAQQAAQPDTAGQERAAVLVHRQAAGMAFVDPQ